MVSRMFYPNAITEDGQRLSTYDGFLKLSDATNQFSIWEDHYGYKLKEVWISDYENGREKVIK